VLDYIKQQATNRESAVQTDILGRNTQSPVKRRCFPKFIHSLMRVTQGGRERTLNGPGCDFGSELTEERLSDEGAVKGCASNSASPGMARLPEGPV